MRVDGKILRKAPEAAAPEALSQRRLPALPSPIEGGEVNREFLIGVVKERQAMAGLGGGL
ncbi:MAG: hypothetical protein M3Z96_01405 [Pseudomonadota bacterium]|nr:hypothetical protein [Pseudomonadota bacterium]